MTSRPRGMVDHVRGKNAQEVKSQKSNDFLNSLKMDTKAAKNGTSANMTAPRNHRTNIKQEFARGADDNGQGLPFYGTNASSIDESDTSGQTRHDHQPIEVDENVEEEGGESAEVNPDEDGSGEDSPDDEHAQRQPRNTTRQVDWLPHVDGDTYPGTTTDPTVPSDTNRNRQDVEAVPVDPAYRAMQIRSRGAGTRVGFLHNEQAHRDRQQQPLQHHGTFAQSHGQRPIPTDVNDLVGDLNEGFSFGPATMRPVQSSHHTAQQTPASKNAPHAQAANPANPSNAAQQGSVRDENQAPAMDRQQRPAQDVPRPITPQIPSKSANPQPKARRKSGQPPPVAPSTHIQPPQAIGSNRGAGKLRPVQMPREEPATEPARDPEPAMEPDTDYSLSTLYSMEFDDIHQQSFDFDPNAGEFKFPDNVATNDLSQKLNVIGKMSPDIQGSFFASLDIETWEEAGDWFLQRFSGLTKQLKDNRRQKRKQVQILEEEIRNRHDAVSKKQKTTIDALSEMKESGGKVLQGTPKKARKSK
ncbi:hypothetical protein PRZ48_009633 [Zasmidium cellare]|uniref:Extracellular mutant protein 11 C-terminal domain-containing protein n=1 Tax=Zasmidium cellare TaxID=395010 RepID=A0ABR0ECZ2_ZASCE|nr:hypothetical protein PRZ48_009633 [Zasmidium cellare]